MGITSAKVVTSFEITKEKLFFKNNKNTKQKGALHLDFFNNNDIILPSIEFTDQNVEPNKTIKLAFFNSPKSAEKKYQKTGDKLDRLIQNVKNTASINGTNSGTISQSSSNSGSNTNINTAPQGSLSGNNMHGHHTHTHDSSSPNNEPDQVAQSSQDGQSIPIPQVTDNEMEKILDTVSGAEQSSSQIKEDEDDGYIMIGNTRIKVNELNHININFNK